MRRALLETVRKRHLLRHECLEKQMFLGRIKGRISRGSQTLKICKIEHNGGHSGRDDGGRTGATGAESREVVFHGRPRQPRRGPRTYQCSKAFIFLMNRQEPVLNKSEP